MKKTNRKLTTTTIEIHGPDLDQIDTACCRVTHVCEYPAPVHKIYGIWDKGDMFNLSRITITKFFISQILTIHYKLFILYNSMCLKTEIKN